MIKQRRVEGRMNAGGNENKLLFLCKFQQFIQNKNSKKDRNKIDFSS